MNMLYVHIMPCSAFTSTLLLILTGNFVICDVSTHDDWLPGKNRAKLHLVTCHSSSASTPCPFKVLGTFYFNTQHYKRKLFNAQPSNL